jgi:hypothetical protein
MPATFQALMNDVLRPYLRRFVLVFFDDILIYSSSWAEHLQHISIVLNEPRAHQLHLKRSKCSFRAPSVAYQGHVISEAGVAMDADKVAAVSAWPQPRSARGLRGFLGLAGYYRKFIRDFGLIAVVNKVIAMYLRCVTGDRPRSWVDWLSWAEYCYNTSFHTALRAIPFEVVYGRPPPPILPYTVGSAKTEAADALLRSRDEMLAEVR